MKYTKHRFRVMNGWVDLEWATSDRGVEVDDVDDLSGYLGVLRRVITKRGSRPTPIIAAPVRAQASRILRRSRPRHLTRLSGRDTTSAPTKDEP